MEVKKAIMCSLLLVLFVLASQEVTNVEARLCQFKSSGFKGPCLSDTNCGQVCISEGFGGGHCDGIRRRCMCQKPC